MIFVFQTLLIGLDDSSKPEIQPIILNEFQPDQVILKNALYAQITGIVAKFLGNTFGDTNLANKVSAIFDNFGGFFKEQTKVSAKKLFNVLTQTYSINPAALYQINGNSTSLGFFGDLTKKILNGLGVQNNPIQQIIHLFQTGKWLNTYELPFFNKNTYLQSDTYQNWSVGNLASTFETQMKAGQDNILHNATEFMKEGFTIDMPAYPMFQLNDICNCRNDRFRFFILFN